MLGWGGVRWGVEGRGQGGEIIRQAQEWGSCHVWVSFKGGASQSGAVSRAIFCRARSAQRSLQASLGRNTAPRELSRSAGQTAPGTASHQLSPSFQVIKPTCAPPIPPVKPGVRGAQPGPTQVRPSLPEQCPPAGAERARFPRRP